MIRMSENVDQIAVALNAAQDEMMSANKDGNNPFFKSKYATLNSVWEVVKGPFLKNGLTVLQPISAEEGKPFVNTLIIHKSGQWISSSCPIVCAKDKDPQALGSAITYARRYDLSSLAGVMTDEDDDANKAMPNRQEAKTEKPAFVPTDEERKVVFADDEAAWTKLIKTVGKERLTPLMEIAGQKFGKNSTAYANLRKIAVERIKG